MIKKVVRSKLMIRIYPKRTKMRKKNRHGSGGRAAMAFSKTSLTGSVIMST